MSPVVANAPLKCVVPLPAACWMVPALMATVVTLAALRICNILRGVLPPIVFPKLIFPAPALNVRPKSPSTVFARVRLLPPEFKAAAFVRVSGAANCKVPRLLIFELRETAPVPD